MSGVAKRTLVSLTRDGNRHVVVVQQFAQFAHCFARDDHARHLRHPQAIGVNPGQSVAIGGDTTQDLAAIDIGDMHVDAVQVIAGFLGRDREFRFVEQAPQNQRGGCEKFAAYSDEAIIGKSSFGNVANAKFDRPASTVRRPVAPRRPGDQCTIGQFAHNLVQSDGEPWWHRRVRPWR